ncbi:MAG: ABC transporter ATP-binding protein [Vicinamibacteria bacterium]
MSDPPTLELRGVGREFRRGAGDVVRALDDVSFSLGAGESLAVMGPSGSGKSTLLSLAGALDRPTRGECRLQGRDVARLDDRALSRLRNRTVGFVFQAFHLIPQLSVAENVEAPLAYGPWPEREWRVRARACLERVGIAHRAAHRPSELSGGELQRAAIARALVSDPVLLLADEPTGNLDSATGDDIVTELLGLAQQGRAVVIVTHDAAIARRAGRQLRLRDGRVVAGEAGA